MTIRTRNGKIIGKTAKQQQRKKSLEKGWKYKYRHTTNSDAALGRGHWHSGKWEDAKARIKIRVCKEIKNGVGEYKENNGQSEENTPSSKQFYLRGIPVIPWQEVNNFLGLFYSSIEGVWTTGRQRKKDLKEPT